MFSDHYRKTSGLAILVVLIAQVGCDQAVAPVQQPPTIFDAVAKNLKTESQEPQEVLPSKYQPNGEPWISAETLPWEANYAQYVNGGRIGFSVVRVEESSLKTNDPAQKIRQIHVIRHDFIDTQVEGQVETVHFELDSVEQNTGRLRNFTLITRLGNQETVLTGGRQPERMTLVTEQFTLNPRESVGKTQKNTAFPEDAWGVLGVQAVMMRPPMVPEEKRSAKVFVPGLNEFVSVEFVAGQPEVTTVFGGAAPELLPIEVTMRTATDGMQSTNWVDERGEIQKTVTRSQRSVETFRVDRATTERFESEIQFKKLVGKSIEFIGELGDSNAIERIAYRVSAEGVDPFGLMSQSEYQRVDSLGPRLARVTVSSSPEFTVLADASSQLPLAEDLEPSALVQSKHEVIAALAEEICVSITEPMSIPEKLNEAVAFRVQLVDLSPRIASALETARKLEGDVNAKAILLVALLRNKGIPARMASGLHIDQAGARAVFHAWVEAFADGHWLALDPNSGQPNPLDKIRFRASSLTEANPFLTVLPTLERIQSITQVQAAVPD